MFPLFSTLTWLDFLPRNPAAYTTLRALASNGPVRKLILTAMLVMSLGSADAADLPALYPRAVLFAEKNPPSETARKLYEAAKEPKELLQLGETASGELMGESKIKYKQELLVKILEYFPPQTDQQTLELPK